MAQPWAKWFYNSSDWIRCRNSYIALCIAKDGGLCEDSCGELGYEVHHEIPLTPENIGEPEITRNHERLSYLCFRCHKQRHRGKENQPRFAFDDNGQPIPPYKKREGSISEDRKQIDK